MAASDPPDYAAESLTLVPTQVPITGKEEFGDVHTPKQAIIKF
jgi:hypothetical protein